MPLVSELGRRVKEKHPGVYDDLADEDVGTRVKTKFPGAYDDFTDTPKLDPLTPSLLQASHAPTMRGDAFGQPEAPPQRPLYAGQPIGYEPQTSGLPLMQPVTDARAMVHRDLDTIMEPIREGIGTVTENLMQRTPLGEGPTNRALTRATGGAAQGLLTPENAEIVGGLAAGGAAAPAIAPALARGAMAYFSGQGAKQFGEVLPEAIQTGGEEGMRQAFEPAIAALLPMLHDFLPEKQPAPIRETPSRFDVEQGYGAPRPVLAAAEPPRRFSPRGVAPDLRQAQKPPLAEPSQAVPEQAALVKALEELKGDQITRPQADEIFPDVEQAPEATPTDPRIARLLSGDAKIGDVVRELEQEAPRVAAIPPENPATLAPRRLSGRERAVQTQKENAEQPGVRVVPGEEGGRSALAFGRGLPEQPPASAGWLEEAAAELREHKQRQAEESKPPEMHFGSGGRITTAEGRKAPFRYAAVEADDLIASHDENLAPDPRAQRDLQGRDREKSASELQVSQIAAAPDFDRLGQAPSPNDGAPTIRADGQVVGGHGRTIGLKRGYRDGTAEPYRAAFAQDAASFGLDPERIGQMRKPVLARVLAEAVTDEKRLAEETNVSTGIELSASELGRQDAARLRPEHLDMAHVDEDLTSPRNQTFATRLINEIVPVNQRGRLMDAATGLSPDGVARVRSALISAAYGDSPTASRLMQELSGDGRNVQRALVDAAPAIAKVRILERAGEIDESRFTEPLLEAAELNRAMTADGKTLDQVLRPKYANLIEPEISPEAEAILRFFEDNKRSGRRMGSFLKAYAEGVAAASAKESAGLFGELDPELLAKKPTLLEVIHGAREQWTRAAEGGQETLPYESGQAGSGVGARAGDPRAAESAGRLKKRPVVGAPEPEGEPGPVASESRLGGRTSGRFAEAMANGGERGSKKRFSSLPRELPAEPTVLDRVREAREEVHQNLSPATFDEQAKLAGGAIRENDAEYHYKQAKLQHRLDGAMKTFDRAPVEESRDFIKKLENGEEQTTPELQQHADDLREVLDEGRDAVQALGTGKLRSFLKDYFPHLYKNVAKAAEFSDGFYDRRSLEGGKGWMKQRYYPTLADAEAAGLTPRFDNPVEYVLAHRAQVDKYVAAHKGINEGKRAGYVREFHIDTPLPVGWKKLDPAFGTVYGARELPVEETVDARLFEGLERFAEKIGVEHKRETGRGGTKGVTWNPSKTVLTQFATPPGVLTHEIGHQLDYRYGLSDFLKGRGVEAELRALADLRHEREDPSPGFKKYIREREEKVANLVDAYVNHRERLRTEFPKTHAAFEDFLSTKGLGGLTDVKPSMVLEGKENAYDLDAVQVKGYLAAPESVARLYNNYLSPGLQNSRIYRGLRALTNTMNQVQLGLSGFHAGFVTLDSMISKTSLGIEQMAQGKIGKGAKNFIAGILPTSPVTTFVRGHKLMGDAFNDPLMSSAFGDVPLPEEAQRVLMAGGRFKQDATYLNDSVRSFKRAINRKEFGSAALHAPGAVMEAMAKPLMEFYVPRMKLGVFADMAQSEIERLGPDASREEVRHALGRAWDSVDNRMGQLAYNNLFWNRTAKDLAMLSVRSLGWNVGDIRELGGAALDVTTIKKRFGGTKLEESPVTHRMAYAMALPIVAGLYGALYQYAKTGKEPEEARDYFFPRTGGKNKDGSPERLNFPSYMKDVYAYKRNFPAGALDTVRGKASPLVSSTFEIISNKDFFGQPLYRKDSIPHATADLAKYIARQLVPFSFRSDGRRDNPDSKIGTVSRFALGAHAAPKYIANPPRPKGSRF